MPTLRETRFAAQGISFCCAICFAAAAVLAGFDVVLGDERSPEVDLYGDSLPAKAKVRLGTVRYRGSGHEVVPLFTAGDETFVTLAGNRKLALLEAATGRTVREFNLGEQYVTSICLTPDRRTLFSLGHAFDENKTVNFQTIKRWNVATGELTGTIRFSARSGSEKFVVTPDGTSLITAAGDGVLHFWDVATGDEILNHKIGPRRVDSLAISPDGQLLAIGASPDLYLWEWTTGKDAVKIPTGGPVRSLAFSPDGLILAEGPDSRGPLTLRDVPSRKVLRTLSNAEEGPMYVNSLAFTADGRSLVAGNAIGIRGLEHRIHFWDVATGKIRRQFGTGEMQPFRIALSGDGRWLAAAGSSAGVKVWDLRTGKLMGRETPVHEGAIFSVQLSRDGRQAVTAGEDGTIRIWDAATGRQSRLLRHAYWVRACALSEDERLIVSSSLDDTVRLWNAATGQEIFNLPGHGRLGGTRAVAFSADQKQFASWGDDFYLRVWDVKTGKALSERIVHPPEIKLPETEDEADRGLGGMDFHRFHVDRAVFSADARLLALTQRTSISLFDVAGSKPPVVIPHEDGLPMSLAFSPDGSRIASSAWGRPVQTQLADGGVRSSSEKNNITRVREIASGATLLEIPLPDGGAGPTAFTSDGRLFAVAGRTPGASIQIFDLSTDEEHATFEAIPPGAAALSFSGDSRRLACAFNDGTALIWDVKPPRNKP